MLLTKKNTYDYGYAKLKLNFNVNSGTFVTSGLRAEANVAL